MGHKKDKRVVVSDRDFIDVRHSGDNVPGKPITLVFDDVDEHRTYRVYMSLETAELIHDDLIGIMAAVRKAREEGNWE